MAQQTWPPPPNLPEPSSEHDAFLTTCVMNAPTKPPMSRLLLVRELRRKTRLDVRQCLAVVNDYCDRHDIFMPRRGARLWLAALLSLMWLVVAAVQIVLQLVFERELDAAPTRLARHLLLGERTRWDGILVCVMFATCILSLFNLRAANELAKRKAEEARAKVAALTGMGSGKVEP